MSKFLRLGLGAVFTLWLALAIVACDLPNRWEDRYFDGTYPITWRTGMIFVAVLLLTQGAARFLSGRNNPD